MKDNIILASIIFVFLNIILGITHLIYNLDKYWIRVLAIGIIAIGCLLLPNDANHAVSEAKE